MGIDPNAGFMEKGGMGEGLIKTFTPLGRIEAGINLVTSLFDPSVRDQSMVGRGVGAVLGDKPLIGNNGVIDTNNLGFGGGFNLFGGGIPTTVPVYERSMQNGVAVSGVAGSDRGWDAGSYTDTGSYGYGTIDGIGVEESEY